MLTDCLGMEPQRKKPKVENHGEREPEEPAMNFVLRQDFILATILDYAIRKQDGKTLCVKSVQNLRLVSKAWKERMSYVLKKSRKPLFCLKLGFANGDSTMWAQRLMKVKPETSDFFFWINLEVWGSFFNPKNTFSLKSFIEQFDGRLRQLDIIRVPFDMNGNLNKYILVEALKPSRWISLDVIDHQNSCSGNALERMRKLNGDKLSIWLQTQLRRNSTLENLLFFNEHSISSLRAPFMHSLQSLTKLELTVQLNDDEVVSLATMSLPYLTHLFLYFHPPSWPCKGPPGLLTRVLENFKNTLRALYLIGDCRCYVKNGVQAVSFPVMRKLNILKTCSMEWELEANISNLDFLFPVLKSLLLFHQAPARLAKWISGTPATNLEDLALSVTRDILTRDARGRRVIRSDQIRKQDIQNIHLKLPNIRSLTLNLTAQSIQALEHIFDKMRQLTSLTISVKQHNENWPSWDSILTGVRKAFVGGKLISVRRPSIMELTGLVKLSLKGPQNFKFKDGEESIISDSTFNDILLKMPNLRKLSLRATFKASDRCKEAWEREGRTILYSPHSLS